jgi:phage-related protein
LVRPPVGVDPAGGRAEFGAGVASPDFHRDGFADLAVGAPDANLQNGRPPDAPPPDFPITSRIRGELRELRVRFANTRNRVLYQRSYNLVVLLHAFEKNTGAVLEADKRLAQGRLDDFEARMDAGRRCPR